VTARSVKRMPQRPATTIALATADDAESIAALRNAVADDLTSRHGRGWWSRQNTPKGVLFEQRISKVYVARARRKFVATFRLATKKPWAIDPAYFTRVDRPIYLHAVAVAPTHQGRGIGSRCLEAAEMIARDWPANAIRVDAFDHAAGAGEFYRKHGFREVGCVTYRGVPLIYFERLL
jgi:GNAT superfamily N-acetyltransferase